MLTRLFRVLHLLSIDIVLGAVILLHFFCRIAGISAQWSAIVLLASAVWVIYTYDHIRDSLRAKDPLRERYRFHMQNHRLLIVVILLLVVSSLFILSYASIEVLVGGCILITLSAIFLFYQRFLSKMAIKELFVALVYTSGVLLIPTLFSEELNYVGFGNLLLLSFTNLIIFSWYEMDEDIKDDFSSVATRLGQNRTKFLLVLLISTGLALALISTERDFRYSFFVLAFFLYCFLIFFKSFFARRNRYRWVGDGVFFLPIIYLI